MITFLPLSVFVALRFIASVPPGDPFLELAPRVSVPDRAPDLVGKAARYGMVGDSKHGGRNPLACAPGHRPTPTMRVCAHRSMRCGTRLVLQSVKTGRVTICAVMDRGPFGRLDANGVWFNGAKHPEREGTWRGILDTTPAIYRELGVRGITELRVWVMSRPARAVKVRRPTS